MILNLRHRYKVNTRYIGTQDCQQATLMVVDSLSDNIV